MCLALFLKKRRPLQSLEEALSFCQIIRTAEELRTPLSPHSLLPIPYSLPTPFPAYLNPKTSAGSPWQAGDFLNERQLAQHLVPAMSFGRESPTSSHAQLLSWVLSPVILRQLFREPNYLKAAIAAAT